MRILIVDDEPISLKKLEVIMSEYGTPETAETGHVALDMFRDAHQQENPYQLITLDIEMPDINGLEILKKIRDWEQMHLQDNQFRAKILMVTCMNDRFSVLSSVKKGISGYILKPFDQEKLNHTLSDLGIAKA
jgi:two-component system chemotaxis response regulator CheY